MNSEGGGTELTVINPTFILGPPLTEAAGSSMHLIKAMFSGQMSAAPRHRFGIADVRDVADLHIRAMAAPGAAGQRYIGVSDRPPITYLELAGFLRERYGQLAPWHRPPRRPGTSRPGLQSTTTGPRTNSAGVPARPRTRSPTRSTACASAASWGNRGGAGVSRLRSAKTASARTKGAFPDARSVAAGEAVPAGRASPGTRLHGCATAGTPQVQGHPVPSSARASRYILTTTSRDNGSCPASGRPGASSGHFRPSGLDLYGPVLAPCLLGRDGMGRHNPASPSLCLAGLRYSSARHSIPVTQDF